MLTVLFVVPPLLWFIWGVDSRLLRRPRLIAAAIGLVALPLLSYAFVYFSGAGHPEWQGAGRWPSTWQWFWSFLSTGQGASSRGPSRHLWREFCADQFVDFCDLTGSRWRLWTQAAIFHALWRSSFSWVAGLATGIR
jgi:hypothetical protein